MKRLLFIVSVFVVSFAAFCEKSDNHSFNNFISFPGGNSVTGGDPSTCAPVDRVRIVEFPSSLSVGTNATIDVTPKDAFGNNRTDACNEKDGNRWDSNDDTCTVSNPTSFKSSVRGVKAGTCELTATVTGKSDTVKFSVN